MGMPSEIAVGGVERRRCGVYEAVVVVAGDRVEDNTFWRSLKLYSILVVILILI
jgi:hypothetical protein